MSCVEVTHHFERPQRQEGVAALTVGPGVPAWILALLQDELLTCEPVSVVTRPAERKHTEIRHLTIWFLSCIGQEVDEDRPLPAQQTHGSNSRSRLHYHRSDLLQSLLRHVFTLCRKLRLTALEVLELEQHHLDDTWSRKSGGGRGGGDSNLQHHLQSRHFLGTLYVAPAPPWLFPAASCSGALCCSDILLIHRSSTLWQQHTHRQSTIHQACTGGAQTDAHRRRKLSVTVQFETHP